MRVTKLPQAIILTKAHRAAVGMVAKGSIVAQVLPLRCLLFLLPNYTIFSVYFLFALFSDEPEEFLPEYSQPAILHAAHFWRVEIAGRNSPVLSISVIFFS